MITSILTDVTFTFTLERALIAGGCSLGVLVVVALIAYDRGNFNGFTDGYENGHVIGYDEGKTDGIDIGYNDGLTEGWQRTDADKWRRDRNTNGQFKTKGKAKRPLAI